MFWKRPSKEAMAEGNKVTLTGILRLMQLSLMEYMQRRIFTDGELYFSDEQPGTKMAGYPGEKAENFIGTEQD